MHRRTEDGKDGVKAKATGLLADLISEFPSDLAFEPEDERTASKMALLPDELIVHMLMSLDPSAIERFAAVNRKARMLSLDSSIWRSVAFPRLV